VGTNINHGEHSKAEIITKDPSRSLRRLCEEIEKAKKRRGKNQKKGGGEGTGTA
jgi:hypothetical protein